MRHPFGSAARHGVAVCLGAWLALGGATGESAPRESDRAACAPAAQGIAAPTPSPSDEPEPGENGACFGSHLEAGPTGESQALAPPSDHPRIAEADRPAPPRG